MRIACLPGFATSHLPGVLAEFLGERPGVTVTLEPDRPERILEWVMGEQYDCGITDGFSGHPAIERVDIPIRTVCILPEGHPLGSKDMITPEDLAGEKIVHSRRNSAFFVQLENCFSQWGVPLNSWIEVRQFTAACTFVSQGYGASIVSALDAAQFEGKGLVARPFEPDLSHDLSILRPITGRATIAGVGFYRGVCGKLQPYLHK